MVYEYYDKYVYETYCQKGGFPKVDFAPTAIAYLIKIHKNL